MTSSLHALTHTDQLATLPLGQLKPTGWLAAQLQRQVDGMAGHLDEFWPDIRDSAWIGGPADGWERGPYWLDGVIPLAFLTGDKGLIGKVQHWVDYILEHQRADGEMGPDSGDPSADHFEGFGDYDAWPRIILLKALLQYRSATEDPRILPAALRLIRRIDDALAQHPLHEWGRVRWADLVLSVNELYDLTGESWLLEVAQRVQAQGYDWSGYATDFPYRDKVDEKTLRRFQAEADGIWMNDHFLATHGANVAMGVKAMPVWWRNTGNPALRDAFGQMLANLDAFHGQATGVFTADEHLAGRHPSQGTETCTVVEYMFSLETAIQTWGLDEDVVDRLERIAYNALPASARPDEWGHQYDQQANQIACRVTDDRIYTNNGPDANLFGLEPQFGCCTANRHQGWPKFAARLWMRSADDGLTALSYAPCRITTVIGGNPIAVAVEGGYPFRDVVTISVNAENDTPLPLHLRIPQWAENATLRIDAEPASQAEAGTVVTLERDWSGQHRIQLRWEPEVRRRSGFNDAVTVSRGPIVFVAPIEERWQQIGGELPHATWAVEPTSSWHPALVVTPSDVNATLGSRPLTTDPFSPEGTPVWLNTRVVAVPGWGPEHGALAAPPASPLLGAGKEERVRLLPYGSARLRITELPWTHAQR